MQSTTMAPEFYVQESSAPPIDAFSLSVRRVFDEARGVLLDKHKDYGPLNIARSPGGPLNGLRVRMHDKLARINHLVERNAEPTYESLGDTFMDMMNYSAIGILVLEGNWPTGESDE